MVRIACSLSADASLLLFKRYTGETRSKSRTPPHWRSAAEDRKRLVEMNEQREAPATDPEEKDVPVTNSTSDSSESRENSKRLRSTIKTASHGEEEEPVAPAIQSSIVRAEMKEKRPSPAEQSSFLFLPVDRDR